MHGDQPSSGPAATPAPGVVAAGERAVAADTIADSVVATGDHARISAVLHVHPSARRNGLAIASMVLGITWVFWFGSILAVIFGHLALRETRRDGTRGFGMAIIGLVLGYIAIADLVGAIITYLRTGT